MNAIEPIRTEADYCAALARVENIFQAQPEEPKFDELGLINRYLCLSAEVLLAAA